MPQNISSPTRKVGAPKMPARSWYMAAWQLPWLPERVEELTDQSRVRDVPVIGEVGPVDGPHERRAPVLVRSEAGDAGGEQSAARELARPPEGNAVLRAHALEIAPHVATLGGKEIEGGVGPALTAEDGPEEDGLPLEDEPGLPGHVLDPAGGGVGVGAGELEPELDGS